MTFRDRLYRIVFENDTRGGRLFDLAIIVLIIASVATVMIDSLPQVTPATRERLKVAEWVFTILFTIEYILRLSASPHQMRYALSFYGIIDLLAVLPTYLAALFPGAHYLLVIRLLRVLRIFRILKLAHYVGESQTIARALVASRHKIGVFLFSVLTLVIVLGSLLYIIEGARSGFDSIPRAAYWAIVTLTTVGYGDLAPRTALGQALASVIMLLGYGMIAVPTGIVTVELGNAARGAHKPRACTRCGTEERDNTSRYCRMCGERLPDTVPAAGLVTTSTG